MASTLRVRAVVVNYNGGELTERCVASILATDWPAGRLDVVVVDNGSRDDVVQHLRGTPRVDVIEAGRNLGFGGACNLALTDLAGVDYAALVNNDATVAPGWLAPLVAALENDRSLGAAVPKVLLESRYSELHLRSPAGVPGRGDRRALAVRVSGLRVEGDDAWSTAHLARGFWEPSWSRPDEPGARWATAEATILVPSPSGPRAPGAVALRLAAATPRRVVLDGGSSVVEVEVDREPQWFAVTVDRPPHDVVNSAGVEVRPDHRGMDRGFLQRDDGQLDHGEDVPAWSGAAVLLSPRYLADVGLFDDRFFLYYEDFDLSWRGRRRGWRYRYVPGSVVRHRHSASSGAGSSLARFHDERNHLLAVAANAPAGSVATTIVRFLLVTASYGRRDVLSRLLRRERPDTSTVRVRLRALASFIVLLPGSLRRRR